MLVGDIGHVARRVDTAGRRAPVAVRHDFPGAVGLHHVGKGCAAGRQAYLHEHPVHADGLLRARLPVAQAQAGQPRAVADGLDGRGVQADGRVRQARQPFAQHGIGFQAVRIFDERHRAADAGQVDGRLDTRVAAPDDGHVASLVERAVAVRAERHAAPGVFRLAGYAELAPRRAGGDDDLRGFEPLARRGQQCFRRTFVGEACYRPVVEHLHPVVLDVPAQVGGQLLARRRCHGDEVLDAGRLVDLPAHATGDDGDAQSLAGGIDGGSRGGRASARHDEVEALRGSGGHGVAPEGVFQLVEQFAERAPPDVEHFPVGDDRRYGLHTDACGLLGPERAVGHVVPDAGVAEGDEVERLHDVGAVGAGERDVGGQADGCLNGADACGGRRVGQVLAFPVGVEQGEDERTELMASGDGAERDAGRLAVAEEFEHEAVALGRLGLYVGRRGRHGAYHVEEFVALGVGGCSRGVQRVAVFERGEYAAQLVGEVFVYEHGA